LEFFGLNVVAPEPEYLDQLYLPYLVIADGISWFPGPGFFKIVDLPSKNTGLSVYI